MRLRSTSLLVAVMAVSSPAVAITANEAGLKGSAYLAAHQTSNGAFFQSDMPSYKVAEILAAYVAGGARRERVDKTLGYISSQSKNLPDKAGRLGLLVMGLFAAGKNPHDFGGQDYVARLKSYYNPTTGVYDQTNIYSDALAILGLVAAGEPVPAEAIRYLKANQCASGGFFHASGCVGGTGDVDTTSIVVNALRAAFLPPSDMAVTRARAFLIDTQNSDGGFPDLKDKPSNANSTGLAITAIRSLDEDPAKFTSGGADPVSALIELQDRDGGFRYSSSSAESDPLASAQAIPALAGARHPISPRAFLSEPTPSLTASPYVGLDRAFGPGSPETANLVSPSASTPLEPTGTVAAQRSSGTSESAGKNATLAIIGGVLTTMVGAGISIRYLKLRSR